MILRVKQGTFLHNIMRNNCIVVASLGRAGSTLLYNSILEIIGYHFGEPMLINNLDDCEYQKGAIYKTHDFPPDNPPNHAKFIWTFADPYEIVISVLKQEQKEGVNRIKKHFKHLNGNFNRYDDIFDYDAMRLEEHFDRWYSEQSFDLLTIKYKSMWNYQNQLSQFVGSYIDLPTFNDRGERFKQLDKERQDKLVDTYSELHNKIEEANKFKRW